MKELNKENLIEFAENIYYDDDNYIKLSRGTLKELDGSCCAIGLLYEEFIGPITMENYTTDCIVCIENLLSKTGVKGIYHAFFHLLSINEYTNSDCLRAKLVRDRLIEIAEKM